MEKLVALTRAVHLDDRKTLHDSLVNLNIVRERKNYDYEMIRGFLRSFYGPMLNDDESEIDLSSGMEFRDIMRNTNALSVMSSAPSASRMAPNQRLLITSRVGAGSVPVVSIDAWSRPRFISRNMPFRQRLTANGR